MSLKANIIENVFFKLGDKLNQSEFVSQLKLQRTYNTLSEIQLYSLQKEKLLKMLRHASRTCSFYKKYASNTADVYEWIKEFPIIDKRTTVDHTDSLVSRKFNKSELIKYESSGSSGLRSTVYLDKKEQSIIRAILINWWEWNGYKFGKPIFQTGMSPKRGWLKKTKDILLSTYYFNAFGLSEDLILKALQDAVRSPKKLLIGYASSLYEIARVANLHKVEAQFDTAISLGDKLFAHYKTEIEQAFHCKVVENYGLNEGIMIGQKKDLPYFYEYVPNVFVEFVDDKNQAVEDGKMGRIIATKLDGFAMPLIRYDTGDLGIRLPRNEYPIQRDLQFPLIKTVVGRNTDIIRTTDGKTLIVHTFTGIFEFFEEIKQFQIVQNVLEEIEVKYIRSDKFDQGVLKRIEAKIAEQTQSHIRIKWHEVKVIAPSKSGKPQLIINNLVKNSLTEQI